MRKILDKSFNYILYIFFTTFILLLYLNVNEHFNLFSIGLYIEAIVICLAALILNKCKKFQARRWYFFFLICMTLFVFAQATHFLLLNNLFSSNFENYEVFNHVMVWIVRFCIALSIVAFLFFVFYCFKDYFKKGYCIQKFDLSCLKMILNAAAYIAICYFLFDYCMNNGVQQHLDLDTGNSYLELITLDFNQFLKPVLIISSIYLVLNIIIDICIYQFFEKNPDKSNNIYK